MYKIGGPYPLSKDTGLCVGFGVGIGVGFGVGLGVGTGVIKCVGKSVGFAPVGCSVGGGGL